MKDNSANWAIVQDWFFDKVLKKEDRLPSIRPQLKESKAQDAAPQKDDPKTNYQNVMLDVSRLMIRFKRPDRLAKVINRIIEERMKVVHCAILLYDSKKNSYVLTDSRGANGKKIPKGFIRLDLKSPLIEFFHEKDVNYYFKNGVVNFRELNWILESGQLLNKGAYLHNKLRLILKEMELLGAELCVPCFHKKDLLGVLILGKKISGRSFCQDESNLLAALANDAAIAVSNTRLIEGLTKKVSEVEHLYEKEHKLFLDTAVALAKAIDVRDVYTHGHTERVTKYCEAIAGELHDIPNLRVDLRFRETLYITALLHDIGKIGIPDRILNKRGKLNAEEMRAVERHPEIGRSILLPVEGLKDIAMCVYSHQEWYNGNGYPNGLKHDRIPLVARIVSVADAFDAMTSDRPYRKKKRMGDAVKEITEYAGTQFDPKIVDCFLNIYEKGIFKSGDYNEDKKIAKGSHSSTKESGRNYPTTLFE